MKIARNSIVTLLVCLILNASGESDPYLYLEGIQGAEPDPVPRGWLRAESFSFDVSRVQLNKGQAIHGGLHIRKRIDQASPTLARWICEGHTIPTLKLNLYTIGDEPLRFYEIELAGAILKELKVQSDTPAEPIEHLQLEYRAIIWTYTQLNNAEDTDSYWNLLSRTGGSLANPDLDNDNMPDPYENAYGLNPAIHDANADKDGDGLTNIQEMMAGTAPNNPDSVLRVSGIYPADGAPPTAEVSWDSVPGKSYDLLFATNAAGPYAPIASITATGTSTTNTVPVPDPNAYYRVQVHAE